MKEQKQIVLKTSSLQLVPLHMAELKEHMEKATNPEQKGIFEVIIKRCEENPNEGIWCTYWDIVDEKGAGKVVGGFYFQGPPERGTVKFKIRIDEEHRCKGYAKEVLQRMVKWCFTNNLLFEVVGVVESENTFAIKALEHTGFVVRDYERNCVEYSVKKPRSMWLGVYLVIGILLGMGLGLVFNSMIFGMLTGLVVSLLIGFSMDTTDIKAREAVTGMKYVKGRKKR